MPLISTRGSLSSRGFGQFSRITGPTLQTFTFPAGSSTFTVPATTNNLISAVGAGADGSPGGTSISSITTQINLLYRRNVSFPGGLPLTWEQLSGGLQTVANIFNNGGTVYYTFNRIEVGTNNLCDFPQNVNAQRDNIVPNTAVATISGGPPASGSVTYANATGVYNYAVIADQQTTFGPSTGADTTGFGLTFPGGAGGPSTTTTFNNVAVVPNQTYVIVNNKSLTITYLA